MVTDRRELIPTMPLARKLAWVTLVRKDESMLMRFIAKLLFFNKRFQSDFWTTVPTPWGTTIYYPTRYATIQDAYKERGVLWHECIHDEQSRRIGGRALGPLLFAAKYLLWPLPVLYARARATYEAEAYASTRSLMYPRADKASDTAWANWVGSTLWSNYGWTYPKHKTAELALDYLERFRREGVD